ncbi:uncharacterized protein LOC120005198 isoform X2 [Tripterygium wilfordii]|uniref:uncharacterized protein LOC120005198 isoform X2 n=1 Tax=Tripterygium wilfordii TaxID=458696 RepID=UPI0018F80950|nr:uncharacterized protein LOC120005198 isoform X2 [Tripterygium wilfordii]
MDPPTPYAYIQSIQAPDVPPPEFQNQPPDPLMSSNGFHTTPSWFCHILVLGIAARGIKDCDTARKVQKADPEKLRRDRLNEQFLELGNALGS